MSVRPIKGLIRAKPALEGAGAMLGAVKTLLHCSPLVTMAKKETTMIQLTEQQLQALATSGAMPPTLDPKT